MKKRQLRRFVAARYPDFCRDDRAGGWYATDGSGCGINDAQAAELAAAELAAAKDGIATMPEWAIDREG